jgi:DNA ligase (NAD+)
MENNNSKALKHKIDILNAIINKLKDINKIMDKIYNNTRIDELVDLITYHQNAYYNGDSKISDAEFDKLWDELSSLDPNNPLLHKIGANNFGFKKIKHIMPMGSQSKANSPEEFEKWFNKMVKEKEHNFIVQYKMDGLSIELQYKNGIFICAVTRGDGIIGDDVTANIIKTGCIIDKLPDNFTGAIRGEVLLSHKRKEKYFADKENCRNAANGCLKRKDGEGCEYLHIIAYDAFSCEAEYNWVDEGEKIWWLKKIGYDVVPLKSFTKCQDIINYRNEVNITRSSYNYDIDGLVVKCNNYTIEDLKRDRPKKQIAFKFIPDEIYSVLLDIEWSASGKYRTPVAICKPVRINGTTVQRANLANYGLIKNLNLKIGDTIILTKRGEIIPKITGVVTTEPNTINKEITPPTICEFCGTKLIKEGAHIICSNENCPEQTAHKILKWINEQNIKFIGESTIHKLVDKGLINSIADIYKPDFFTHLKTDDIVGEKMAVKICDNINKTRDITLSNFIGGLDIDHIGTRIIDSLVKFGFDTLNKIMNASMGDLAMCAGINTGLAGHIKKGLMKKATEISELLQYVNITNSNVVGIFTGKTACFTGSFGKYSRKELENMFTARGGKIGNKIHSNTEFLVSNTIDSTSSKTLAAKTSGIPIISENQFLELLESTT